MRNTSLAEVVQVDTGARVPSVVGVEGEHQETAAGLVTPLSRYAAGDDKPAGLQAGVECPVRRVENCSVCRSVRMIHPVRRTRDACNVLQHTVLTK